jgi:2-oxoglutarate ferredoxin oxidoreductase subunit gamma
MSRTEIKISGFGGQGVIMSAAVVGKAASIFDNKHATMIQSFGPEARGSSCSATVIVDDEKVTYPYVKHPQILVVMSQESFTKFGKELTPDGILIAEEDLIHIDHLNPGVKLFTVPATRIAEELGKKLVLNIVMVGFFTAVTNVISHDAMKKAVLDSIPKGTEELNLKAFERGYEYGMQIIKEKSEALAV